VVGLVAVALNNASAMVEKVWIAFQNFPRVWLHRDVQCHLHPKWFIPGGGIGGRGFEQRISDGREGLDRILKFSVRSFL
jgi:hypothetical protein